MDKKHTVIGYFLKIGKYNILSDDGKYQRFTEQLEKIECNFYPKIKLYEIGKIISITLIDENGCMIWYTFNDSEQATTVTMLLNHDTTQKKTGCSTKFDAVCIPIATVLSRDTTGWVKELNARIITYLKPKRFQGNYGRLHLQVLLVIILVGWHGF